jgi:hypothetical protein
MADQPSRSDFQVAAHEITAPQLREEPTRPETVRSAVAGWAQSPDRFSQETSAIKAVKIAAQMKEQRHPDQPAQPEVKQAEKNQADKTKEALEKISTDLAPKEKSSPDQQRQQERQKQTDQRDR